MAVIWYTKAVEQYFAPAQEAIDRIERDQQQAKGALLFQGPRGTTASKADSKPIGPKIKPGD